MTDGRAIKVLGKGRKARTTEYSTEAQRAKQWRASSGLKNVSSENSSQLEFDYAPHLP